MQRRVGYYNSRAEAAGKARWEIRLSDIKLKLIITVEAPASGSHSVSIIRLVVNILFLLACVKYWKARKRTVTAIDNRQTTSSVILRGNFMENIFSMVQVIKIWVD